MKNLFLILLFALGCSTPSGNPNGNGPTTPTTSSGLTYMGVCNINPPSLIFLPDLVSKQTWTVGNPPEIEQGLCQPEER